MKKIFTLIATLVAILVPLPARADRIVTSGFEFNSTTAAMEPQLETVTGTAFTVQGTTKRSGNYAAKFLPSSSNGYVTMNHTALTTGNTIYHRFYLFVTTSFPADAHIYQANMQMMLEMWKGLWQT
jgi:hypothetical protein